MKGIVEILDELWEHVPDALKVDDNYNFHVSNDWTGVPKIHKGKRVVIFNVPVKEYANYAHRIDFKDVDIEGTH